MKQKEVDPRTNNFANKAIRPSLFFLFVSLLFWFHILATPFLMFSFWMRPKKTCNIDHFFITRFIGVSCCVCHYQIIYLRAVHFCIYKTEIIIIVLKSLRVTGRICSLMVGEVNRPGEFIKSTLLYHRHTYTISPNPITKKKKERNNIPQCQENIRDKRQTKQTRACACDATIKNAASITRNLF